MRKKSKIYTRTGDNGVTRLGNGDLIPKDSLRIEAIGTIDELSSTLGMVLSYALPITIRDCLVEIQRVLIDLGGDLAISNRSFITTAHVLRLEECIDVFDESLPPLREFILPAGSAVVTTCHLARTVCRRAERRVVALKHHETVNKEISIFLNRLADLLFVLARVLDQIEHLDKEL